jgi:hypothetical protein
MARPTAAAYCDMTPAQFDRQCPVPAKDQGWRGLRWDRAMLDAWIDNMPNKIADPKTTPACPLDCAPEDPAGRVAAMSAAERRAASLARL